jgi:hypothetical protein
MWLVLLLIAAAFLWFGIDALSLARHVSPPNQTERDEMMFGKWHKRPVSQWTRSFTERRYPIASAGSAKIYGWLLIALGLFFALLALGAVQSAV